MIVVAAVLCFVMLIECVLLVCSVGLFINACTFYCANEANPNRLQIISCEWVHTYPIKRYVKQIYCEAFSFKMHTHSIYVDYMGKESKRVNKRIQPLETMVHNLFICRCY